MRVLRDTPTSFEADSPPDTLPGTLAATVLTGALFAAVVLMGRDGPGVGLAGALLVALGAGYACRTCFIGRSFKVDRDAPDVVVLFNGPAWWRRDACALHRIVSVEDPYPARWPFAKVDVRLKVNDGRRLIIARARPWGGKDRRSAVAAQGRLADRLRELMNLPLRDPTAGLMRVVRAHDEQV